MAYKYAVFDWDGTLANTYPVISAAYDYVFERLNLPKISYDKLVKITGTLQNKNMLEYVFGERSREAAVFYYDYIEKHHTECLSAVDGAKDLLSFCKDKELELYLLTNKKTKFIQEELLALDFAKYFKKVVAAGEYAEDKPHPIACKALFDNNLPQAKDIVVVGDGVADIKTAQALGGSDCIFINKNNKVQQIKPKYVAENLFEVKNILEKTNNE